MLRIRLLAFSFMGAPMNGMEPLTAKCRRISRLCVVTIALLGGAGPATAGELMADLNTCTTLDCNATTIPGFVNGWTAGGNLNTGPWVGQVFAAANECLRLRVTAQGSLNTEMVVIAASGNFYRNDNSGIAPCANCPLIKFRTGSVGGWHTVQISQASGTSASGAFKLSYGRYNNANPNCASPTPPVP
jgi:hypothetical protein